MAEREIDATPSKRAAERPPMSVDDALAYADAQEWKTFKSKGDVALIALAAEVRFLRGLIDVAPAYLQQAADSRAAEPV